MPVAAVARLPGPKIPGNPAVAGSAADWWRSARWARHLTAAVSRRLSAPPASLNNMIRAAKPSDVPAIHTMIRELAAYERAPQDARATEEQLRVALFGADPAVFALLAEEAGEPVGFAVWFLSFSTWTGTHGVYLEDLYVSPAARGGGHGKALLAELARICVEHGYERCEWSVLDWNEPAIGFYRSIGAAPMDGWTVRRLVGEPLRTLAAQAAVIATEMAPTRGSGKAAASLPN